MALQVGELFASLTVDTDGAEQAMERIRAMGEETAAALGRTLGGDAGQRIAEELAAGVAAELSAGTGVGIGGAFGEGIAQGIRSMRGSVLAAASGLAAEAGRVLEQAMPSGAPMKGTSGGYAAGSAPEASARQTGNEGAFAWMVAQALEGVSVRLDGKAVGSLVAPAVGQAIAENVVSRRYGTE